MKRKIILGIFVFIILIPFLFLTFQYFSRATSVKAKIVIDTKRKLGPVPDRWKALAQGGEEKGRMLGNIVSEISGLYPKYIRLDHIYDYYDVVSRAPSGNLVFNWSKLDETVCDIYHAGAKPFFSLGYMPAAISSDGSLISIPGEWTEWELIVQKTIEHYSSDKIRLCGQVTGDWMKDIYYEVWNEPDLETFGKWSLYGGAKDYKMLYFYSAQGANKAKNVNRFLLGGPVTTALYQNWIQRFLEFITDNNLRLDFISWHHYSKNAEDYVEDIIKLNNWLLPVQYSRYRQLPRIISEWGYDSDPNPMADTNIGAAHTVASIRNFINSGFELAFLFEIKDGPSPRWGILSYEGDKKPRYDALKMLNLLEGNTLIIDGEGSHVKALASMNDRKISIILVNYDQENKNTELVPMTINNLDVGSYTINTYYLDGKTTSAIINVSTDSIKRNVLMEPNSVIALEIIKSQ